MRLSYDLPFLFGPREKVDEVVIIKMDEQSHRERKQVYGQIWDRSLHARLLNQLKEDGAKLVVFDIFFADTGPPAADQALADAMRNHGRVVLAADRVPISQPRIRGEDTIEPLEIFRQAVGTNWGISKVRRDGDLCVRLHYPGTADVPSLARAAADAYGMTPRPDPDERLAERWIRYYGPPGALYSISYHFALDKQRGFFSDKIVFIGGKPLTEFVGGESDEYATPFTRWDDRFAAGVEIEATMFLNLVRGDSLTRLSPTPELLIVVLAGILFGCGFSFARPIPGLGWACFTSLSVSTVALMLFWKQRVWFDWTLVAGLQIPLAWACSAVLYTKKLFREKQFLERRIETEKFLREMTPAPEAAHAAPLRPSAAEVTSTPHNKPPEAREAIGDYEVLKCIGSGSYGEVLLVRNVTGGFRALKRVYRKSFPDDRPYEREFTGLKNFEPISRRHAGWVSILHVGRNEQEGFFYYVMEAADDARWGSEWEQHIQPVDYVPRTLGRILADQAWLPLRECLRIAASLTDSLGKLHNVGLIHRDIKPSNIIFVNDDPKLADIGLVREIVLDGERPTIVGTEGFLAPEVPGKPPADIYSLGKVIYQAATGCDPTRHPELPTSLGERRDARELIRLIEIVNKACEKDFRDRYPSAIDLYVDLKNLQSSLGWGGN